MSICLMPLLGPSGYDLESAQIVFELDPAAVARHLGTRNHHCFSSIVIEHGVQGRIKELSPPLYNTVVLFWGGLLSTLPCSLSNRSNELFRKQAARIL